MNALVVVGIIWFVAVVVPMLFVVAQAFVPLASRRSAELRKKHGY